MAGTVAEDLCGAVAHGLPARLPFGCRAAPRQRLAWVLTHPTAWLAAAASLVAAVRRSSAEWVAIATRRSLEVPSGTVGGRIACANTPACSAVSHRSVAA